MGRSYDGDLAGFVPPLPGTPTELTENWNKVKELEQALRVQKKRAEDAEARAEAARLDLESRARTLDSDYEVKLADLSGREADLKDEQADLEPERQRLSSENARLQTWQTELQATEERLHQEEMRLRERELDAEAGLVARKRELLAGIDVEVARYSETVSQLAHSLVEERNQALQELHARLAELRTTEEARLAKEEASLLGELKQKQGALEVQIAELQKEREGLQGQRTSLRREQARLQADQQLLREDQQAFDEKVERMVAARAAGVAAELAAVRVQLEKARSEREQLALRLEERADLERQFRGRSPEDLLRELEAVRLDNERLGKELAARPSQDDLIRLQVLDQERQEWEADRILLKQRIAELEWGLSKYQTSVIEVETLRDQKAAYEASNQLLRKHIEELRTDVERRVQQGEQKEVFPACFAMDRDSDLQDAVETEDVADLAALVLSVQQRMASNSKGQGRRFYTLQDVRSFVAGLAMSRLTILQGVSGTGKTSLPLAFVEAIGGGEAFIEVQAGWRDRQDLIGHFNSFEGRFHEAKFLQALYKAQCPMYHDRPFLILLDEMNLSHAEQYFADLIAALELEDETRRKIDLMSGPLPEGAIPRLLINNGRTIRIPENVWFVGTANQDETTKDFADKTYDRSHIMELPIKHPTFESDPKLGSAPRQISCNSLRAAFAAAQEKHAKEAAHAFTFLEENLREYMGFRFRVGWGNRLERQINRYVPVVLAAKGNLSEAMDYLLAMKVLRKLRNRYENRVSDIDAFCDHLGNIWPKLDSTPLDPAKSKQVAILQGELQRLRRSTTDEPDQ